MITDSYRDRRRVASTIRKVMDELNRHKRKKEKERENRRRIGALVKFIRRATLRMQSLSQTLAVFYPRHCSESDVPSDIYEPIRTHACKHTYKHSRSRDARINSQLKMAQTINCISFTFAHRYREIIEGPLNINYGKYLSEQMDRLWEVGWIVLELCGDERARQRSREISRARSVHE